MSSTECTECQELTIDDDHSDHESDSDVPSDQSDDEGLDKPDDDAEELEKQSDDEATEIFNRMYGPPPGDYEASDLENSDKLAQYRATGNNRRGGGTSRGGTSGGGGDRVRVLMPSGKTFRITTPKPKVWPCRDSNGNVIKSLMITLHNFGRSKSEYRIVQKEMDNTIVSHPNQTFKSYRIIKLEKIINGCLWKKYRHRQNEIKVDKKNKINQRMLFHGSTSVNYIAHNGFNEQWSSKSGMFGAGLYFAENSSKANQYVFGSAKAAVCPTHNNSCCFQCVRQMLLCRVSMGRTKIEYTKTTNAHAPVGYDSVTGLPSNVIGGLKYPEYIVYRNEQVYPEYLITYKISM